MTKVMLEGVPAVKVPVEAEVAGVPGVVTPAEPRRAMLVTVLVLVL